MAMPFQPVGRKSGCSIAQMDKSVEFGHWHKLYKPRWWQLRARWKRHRNRVTGTLVRYEDYVR